MGDNEGGAANHPLLYRYRFGSAELDEAKLELRVDGLVVSLEQKPLQVLIRLLRNANDVVTREAMFDEIWNGRATVEHVLNNAIRKLRLALGDPGGDCVVTVPRVGYKLQAAVERTAVGRKLTSRLALASGGAIPGRSDFVLEAQLGASPGNEVWCARGKAGALHVFKFSLDGEHLVALKREVSLYRVLREGLGERDDFVSVLRWNFDTLPFYIELDHAGENLAAWSSRHDGLRSLAIEQRIEMFLQIADAVAAAHSVGVLHKDIKPTNILVMPGEGGGFRTRIADFGSGRLLEPGRIEELGFSTLGMNVTRNAIAGSVTGTPLYIAPELLAGHAPTVQTDLYALGLLLYQMSAGDLRRPMASDWENEIEDPMLRADIAAATAGEPKRRLGSVTELTSRLRSRDARRLEQAQRRMSEQRALAAEKQLERWRARRPWLLTAAASLIVGTCLSLFLFGRAITSQHKAEQEARRQQAVSDFLNEILRGADPGGPEARRNLTVEDALARAATRASKGFADDPVTKAAIHSSLGGAYFGLGEYATAARYQKEAATLLAASRGSGDSATLSAEYAMARSVDMDSRHTEARAILDQADRDAGSLLQTDLPLALLAHWARGGNALMQLQPALALPEFEMADRIRARAAPTDTTWLIRLRTDLAWCYVRLQRPEDALRMLQELMASDYTPERIGAFDWARVHLQYALALMALSRFDDAAGALLATIDSLSESLGPYHYLTGLTWSHLAAVYQAQSQWDKALDAGQHGYAILRKAAGERSQATLSALGDLGAINYLAGRVDEAIPTLQAAHAMLSDVTGTSSSLTQYVRFYLASALNDAGKLQDAGILASQLSADALASVYPASDWGVRLEGLRRQIAVRRGKQADASLHPSARAFTLRCEAPYFIEKGTCTQAGQN